MQEDITQNAVT